MSLALAAVPSHVRCIVDGKVIVTQTGNGFLNADGEICETGLARLTDESARRRGAR
jgi:hypothetical protein